MRVCPTPAFQCCLRMWIGGLFDVGLMAKIQKDYGRFREPRAPLQPGVC